MPFLDNMLGGRGCNVDGTTSNNPIMQLTDQLMDTIFLPQNQGVGQGLGADHQGGYEEVSVVKRGSQSAHVQSGQAQQWQSQFMASQQHSLGMNMASGQHQHLENIWQQSAMNPPSAMGMQQHHNRMAMEQHFMAQQMLMQQQNLMQQRRNFAERQRFQEDTSDSMKDVESADQKKAVDSDQKEESTADDELQSMLEEAWNAEGIQGTPEELKQFWEGMLRRREQGESIDDTWMSLHESAMKNAWKPPETATASLHDNSLGARVESANSLKQYSFDTDNPYLSTSTSTTAGKGADSVSGSNSAGEQQSCDELFDKGMQYYTEGHVDEAILTFEAAIQSHPEVRGGDLETATAVDEMWNMLGKCHAEMDKDTEAILCYQQALEHDPFNLSALLALGTSHVNEMNSMEALECLQGWVKHNPKFHGLEARLKKQYNTDTADDVYADGSLMDEVLQLMLAVTSFDPTDAEGQVVLGVLQNVTQDHEAAAGAFHKALDHNPQDFGLLNKIGATLANGENSAAAIQYYAKALKIRPLYARGWLNLGIAYANLGQYDEAVKAYVQALAISPDAMHIWDYLESIFTFQRQYDLVAMSQATRDPMALADKMNLTISTPLYSKK